ncbi:MAG: lasso RiPP family leader peptide-containing protein [Vicinamibacterales bacterium]|nr:lasso RiPP family leader peptide-containing protein [Vicinamibacterales bacterium]
MTEKTSSPAKVGDRDRTYEPPVLVEYGTIAKLTQSGGSTRQEGGVPVMRTGCL